MIIKGNHNSQLSILNSQFSNSQFSNSQFSNSQFSNSQFSNSQFSTLNSLTLNSHFFYYTIGSDMPCIFWYISSANTSVMPEMKSMTAMTRVSKSGLLMSYWLLNRLRSCSE